MIETGNQLKGYIQRETNKYKINSNYGYNYFFTRAFIEKIYHNISMKLVLKGSYSQFIRLGKIERPLTDMDIITYNRIEDAKEQIDDIINNNDNSNIKFKILNQFTTTNATLNYKILCDFDGKTGRISLDLKREEILDYSPAPMPLLFTKDKTFITQSISIEEHLASKLYIVLLHMKLYTVLSRNFRRLKDFFDIHTILGSGNIDEHKVFEILEKRIKEDEFLRDYELQGPLFKQSFIEDNKNNWEIDKKKYQFLTPTTFNDAVEVTNDFIKKKR